MPETEVMAQHRIGQGALCLRLSHVCSGARIYAERQLEVLRTRVTLAAHRRLKSDRSHLATSLPAALLQSGGPALLRPTGGAPSGGGVAPAPAVPAVGAPAGGPVAAGAPPRPPLGGRGAHGGGNSKAGGPGGTGAAGGALLRGTAAAAVAGGEPFDRPSPTDSAASATTASTPPASGASPGAGAPGAPAPVEHGAVDLPGYVVDSLLRVLELSGRACPGPWYPTLGFGVVLLQLLCC